MTPETKQLLSHLSTAQSTFPKRSGIVTGLYQSKDAKLIGYPWSSLATPADLGPITRATGTGGRRRGGACE